MSTSATPRDVVSFLLVAVLVVVFVAATVGKPSVEGGGYVGGTGDGGDDGGDGGGCESTWDVGMDRAGHDYSNFALSGEDPALCMDECCSQADLCQSWVYCQPGITNPVLPWCWLKDGVPTSSPLTGVTSGVLVPDYSVPPLLPSSFSLKMRVQQNPVPGQASAMSGDMSLDYDYSSGQVCWHYEDDVSGSLTAIALDYASLKQYTLQEEILANGTVTVFCNTSAISGVLFGPTYLRDHLSFSAPSWVLTQEATEFTSADLGLPMNGGQPVTMYFSNTAPQQPLRAFSGSLMYEMVSYLTTTAPTLNYCSDTILICNA
ncbi:hypothetical protein Pelo_11672 [Pelomyxa schiedti]|nr:hypothetical protein Pelo_11672 [Pelomyxa schiedti]